MKPSLPRILSAVPRTLHVQLEITKAIRALAGPDEQRRAETSAVHLQEGCRRWLQALSQLNASPSSAAKAAADDPKHPGWPAGSPGGRGGRFRPKDGQSGFTDRPSSAPGIGHNEGPPLEEPPVEEPPKAPLSKPPSVQQIWSLARLAARWLAIAAVEAAEPPIGEILLAVQIATALIYLLHSASGRAGIGGAPRTVRRGVHTGAWARS